MTLKHPATLFGRRLRAARQRACLPQDKLGVQIGLDEATASARISRYETGVHEPPFGLAVKIAKTLHVPTAYFYCEDDELAKVILAWEELSLIARKNVQKILRAEASD
ncbi:MAG: helix-turn-helix domain-containing protein [Betaproteobacteria bacterium]|nr:helix-turn-helix domain-containing protein [Betaproteobacteria bacterium]